MQVQLLSWPLGRAKKKDGEGRGIARKRAWVFVGFSTLVEMVGCKGDINGDNLAQMLRDGFPDNYCHDSQWSLHYVLPDIAYQGAIMRIVKKGLHGLRTMSSCLGSGSKSEAEIRD